MGLDPSLSFPPEGEGEPVAFLARLAAAARLVASFAALSMLLQFHAAPGPALALPLLFAAYGGALYWRAVANPAAKERTAFYLIDTAWFIALILATGGPMSPFVLFLLFPILFISFRHGFAPGMGMTAASALLLPLSVVPVGHLHGVMGRDLLPALAPSAALLVSGYLIATWASSGLEMNRRLSLLRSLNTECGPRQAPEQMVDVCVRRLASLHPISSYLLLMEEAGLPPRLLQGEPGAGPKPPDSRYLQHLLPLMQRLDGPLVWRQGRRGGRLIGASSLESQLLARQRENADEVAAFLGCLSFCLVALPLRDGARASLLLASGTHRFDAEELGFFELMAQQLGPRLASASLLDRLALQVADYERQKISRDVHDSAIQPYIGLKFALEAIARKMPDGDPVRGDIDKLVEMASIEIGELRRYVKTLRGEGERGRAALVPAIQRQAARFAELYGIHVAVSAPDDLSVGDDLAEEAFHMIGEGLSNIRRHTTATRAKIELNCTDGLFCFRIANPATTPTRFIPRSITERAASLGGDCHVDSDDNETAVVVTLPLLHAESQIVAA